MLSLNDFTEEDIAAIEAAEPSEESKQFDHEVEGWEVEGWLDKAPSADPQPCHTLQLSLEFRISPGPRGGQKIRPFAIVAAVRRTPEGTMVLVLPVTHTHPGQAF